MNGLKNRDVFKALEKWAPKSLAYEWDNVGLQIGSADKSVKKVLITLDVLEAVVDEAIDKKIDLIIAHHPLIFKPLKNIDTLTPKGKVIEKLIKHEISVYAAHTNLDIAEGGVNDLLSTALNLKEVTYLKETQHLPYYKLIAYVPNTHTQIVRDAILNVGAGSLGDYSHCSYKTEGEGSFKPLDHAKPYLGTHQKFECVEEDRLEFSVHPSLLNDAISALKERHPYEEIAYDVFELTNLFEKQGIGRIGSLDETLSLHDFIDLVKGAYEIDYLTVSGNLNKEISRVAVLGGSGEKYIADALKCGADVLVTGDVSFHLAQDAIESGLAVIDAGHYIEKIMKEATSSYLKKALDDKINVKVSKINTNPFQII